jgi:uncharacterized protein YjbI with pentapeptide repeats
VPRRRPVLWLADRAFGPLPRAVDRFFRKAPGVLGRLAGLAGLCLLAGLTWLRTEGGFDHYVMRAIDFAEQVRGEAFDFYLPEDGTIPAWLAHLSDEDRKSLEPEMAQELWVRAHVLTLDDVAVALPPADRSDPGSDDVVVALPPAVGSDPESADVRAFNRQPAILRYVISAFPGQWTTSSLAPADLAGDALGQRPPDWRDWNDARAAFRPDWCKSKSTIPEECALLTYPEDDEDPSLSARRAALCVGYGAQEVEACLDRLELLAGDFAADWERERQRAREAVAALDLSRADLRGASMGGAFLVNADLGRARLEGAVLNGARMEGANLSEARMEGAGLEGARMEGADLSRARMERANLWLARMEGADLSEARMERANLWLARMEGAVLREARMERADLFGARMEGADLRWARMEGAFLSEARMEGADLWGARMEGANLTWARMERASWAGTVPNAARAHHADLTAGQDLTQAQLETVIGNRVTLLGADAETGQPLHVWTCWETPPSGFDTLLANLTRLGEPEEDIRRAYLCQHRERRRTGTYVPALVLQHPQGFPGGQPLVPNPRPAR